MAEPILDESGTVTDKQPQAIPLMEPGGALGGIHFTTRGPRSTRVGCLQYVASGKKRPSCATGLTHMWQRVPRNSPAKRHFDVAPAPRGQAGFAATLGGNGYGVSRYSRHPREAAMLVRFLASPEEQARRCRKPSEPPTVPALYKNADVLGTNPHVSRVLQAHEGAALRPSVPAGKCIRRGYRARIMKRCMPCLPKGRAPQTRQATCKSNW